MLLATQCPYCKTTFKVANDQLKLQSGLVRCGICHQVFNGIEHLAATDPNISTVKINPATAASRAPHQDTNESTSEPTSTVLSPLSASKEALQNPQEPEFDLFDLLKVEPSLHDEVATNPVAKPEAESKAEAEKAPIATPDFPQISIEDQVQALLDADLAAEEFSSHPIPFDSLDQEIIVGNEVPADEPEFHVDQDQSQTGEPRLNDVQLPAPTKPKDIRSMLFSAAPDEEDNATADDKSLQDLNFIRQANRKKRMAWVYGIGTVLLCLTMIGQSAYQFRDFIAAYYPPSKEALSTMCKIVHCHVRLPAQADAISYEADELHTLPRENTFEFSLLLHNRSTLPQAWPMIELTLKDPQKQVVLKRIFTPTEYLANPKEVLTGFPANQEQPVKLYFETEKVKASDYVVAVFYS